MAVATLLVDNREQKPWDFSNYPFQTKNVTLRTGDYTLEVFCDYNDEHESYEPEFAIERKSGPDLLNSITHDRDRFKREIKRAAEWDDPLHVVVADSYATFTHNLDFMQYRDVHPNQVTGTIDSWTEAYNVNFHFKNNRQSAAEFTYNKLMARLQSWLL